jgi:hypothetical protein
MKLIVAFRSFANVPKMATVLFPLSDAFVENMCEWKVMCRVCGKFSDRARRLHGCVLQAEAALWLDDFCK